MPELLGMAVIAADVSVVFVDEASALADERAVVSVEAEQVVMAGVAEEEVTKLEPEPVDEVAPEAAISEVAEEVPIVGRGTTRGPGGMGPELLADSWVCRALRQIMPDPFTVPEGG